MSASESSNLGSAGRRASLSLRIRTPWHVLAAVLKSTRTGFHHSFLPPKRLFYAQFPSVHRPFCRDESFLSMGCFGHSQLLWTQDSSSTHGRMTSKVVCHQGVAEAIQRPMGPASAPPGGICPAVLWASRPSSPRRAQIDAGEPTQGHRPRATKHSSQWAVGSLPGL